MLFSVVESRASGLVALSDRQRGVLRGAREALSRARRLCDESPVLADGAELIALEVREAVDALSLLVGEVATEESPEFHRI